MKSATEAGTGRLCLSLTNTVTAAGDGADAVLAAWDRDPAPPATTPGEGWPPRPVRPIEDFDVRERLGRKGTRSLDRAAALVLAAVDGLGERMRERGDELGGEDVGFVLGTTAGSLASTIGFTVDGLVGDRPYLVDPARFPNTVMNFAAGQCAIRFSLRGPNATVATGRIAGLQAVRYAHRLLRSGQAARVLAGGTEELTAQRAWVEADEVLPVALGEAAAVAVLELRDPDDRGPAVVVEGLESGFAPGGDGPALLAELSGRLAERSGAPIDAVFPSSGEGGSSPEAKALLGGAAPGAAVVSVADVLGDAGAAGFPVQLAVAARSLEREGAGRALVSVLDPAGHVGVLALSVTGGGA